MIIEKSCVGVVDVVETNPLVGRYVVIMMRDGFKKAAFLLDFQPNYIIVRFRDGRVETIAWDTIAKVTEDKVGR